MPPDEIADQAFARQQLTIRKKVTFILENYLVTRSNDALFLQLYAREFENIELPFPQMSNSIASIIRERRRIQKERPELRATEAVQEMRDRNSAEYIGFYGKENAGNNRPGNDNN